MSTETIPSQQDLDFNLEPPDWVAVKLLLDKVDAELAARRKHLLRRVSEWFLAIELFQEFEDQRMVLNNPTRRDEEFRRVVLTKLMSQGEDLNMELAKAQDVDPGSIGVDQKDVTANVAWLRDRYIRLYGEQTEIRRKAVLEEVFGAEAG
jgi:hypothetical protein